LNDEGSIKNEDIVREYRKMFLRAALRLHA